MLLSELKSNYDYSKEGKYIIIKLRKRKNDYQEIAIDWFDYNPGNKFEWLLVRECQINRQGKKKYTNYKLKNICPLVKVQVQVFQKGEEEVCV
ncbi:DUF5513 family protein [Bacillus cytotoxicus]|uniref:DUF5513 family protein n=1 Tax=Bacillus cereus group TaxID=86661 RepID=UPI000B966F21|nr:MULTISPECIES: DUF5513 family protein [Bacillus cereus group]AWC30973.1 hypothetical protein CG483_022400 [Bacillus cytotoxicus]AWC35076.1 hypothetical protein CG482_022755 [Bacillus cytotoxicus]AWC39042.1 hypothetical protein CG481_022345 [Bacillus cytotoxicus]AWC43065.1 hypothetical protein CG480_022235 [Bacillus cytotoxicus]AWC47022.1 hypothetical protein CG479_021715 [Bacillus cytotoxicus]